MAIPLTVIIIQTLMILLVEIILMEMILTQPTQEIILTVLRSGTRHATTPTIQLEVEMTLKMEPVTIILQPTKPMAQMEATTPTITVVMGTTLLMKQMRHHSPLLKSTP
jgi:hypothetical protein